MIIIIGLPFQRRQREQNYDYNNRDLCNVCAAYIARAVFSTFSFIIVLYHNRFFSLSFYMEISRLWRRGVAATEQVELLEGFSSGLPDWST